MKDGYIYVTVPLAEPTPEGNRKPLVELLSVTVGLQLLRSIMEIVDPVVSSKKTDVVDGYSALLGEVLQFMCWSAPFGSPVDLSVSNFRLHQQQQLQQKGGKQLKRRTSDSLQPAWRPLNFTGSSKLTIVVKEYIRAVLYDRANVPDVWDTYGVVRCKAEVEGSSDVQLTLCSPKDCPPVDHIMVHPCVKKADTDDLQSQGPSKTDVTRKIRFSGPLENFDLCTYRVPGVSQVPIEGYYQMQGSKQSVRLLVQLKLNTAVKNEFEYFTVYIPYFNRGLIEKVENLDIVPASSNISGSVNRRQLIWEIGQKFPSKTLKVTLQCDVCFSPDLPPKDSDFKEDPFCVNDNAYILVSFKCLDHVYSGVRIDPKSVSLIPSSKCKTSIGYEFSCTEYKIWNSHGDCDMAFLPNSADLEMLKQ